jgi:hypothetical protein
MAKYYIYSVSGALVGIARDHSQLNQYRKTFPGSSEITSWEIKSLEQATMIARDASVFTGQTYIPIDEGEYVSPRYSVMKSFHAGDDVSRGFNGYYYPEGYIVKITDRIITTSTGMKFYRKKLTSSWLYNRMWHLCSGHIYEQNPSF